MEMEEEKLVREVGDGAETHGIPAPLHSEADLTDHSDDHELSQTEAQEIVDYHKFTKPQLIEVLKQQLREPDYKNLDRHLREIKAVVDEYFEKEKTTALNRFILEGGIPADFAYKGDAHDAAIESLVKQLRDKKTGFLRSQEDSKNENYRIKLALLERIRQLIDEVDVSANQFEQFKELQRQWKATGAVPGTHAKTMWANYHALVDRFYDNQSIYFELKELDRKKNLEAKLDLCVRAEKLKEVTHLRDAVKELNELHHEFKHIGPVPRDEKESVWQRFKSASDAIYARRDEFVQNLQQELTANLEQKIKLVEEISSFAYFQTEKIKEWNQKTKEILEIQKRWEGIGGMPRARARELNKKFWSAFKGFFNAKNTYFRKLDAEREGNLAQKKDLIARAIAMRDSTDWAKTAQELKTLQMQWKDIGPVPEKVREKVYKEFKEACDYFFEQKRGQHSRQEHEQEENLKAKAEVCAALERHALEKTGSPEVLSELEARFASLGYVPRKEMNALRNRYHEAVEKLVQSLESISAEEKSRMLMQHQLADLKNDPEADRKIYAREQAIRKKIAKIENDISLWRNNLEFFARSKNADGLRAEFNEKISQATHHLGELKGQLKLLRQVVA